MIKDLSAPFPASDVKKHPIHKGKDGKPCDYLPINKIEQRLNEVFGIEWSWMLDNVTLDTEKQFAWVSGRITYNGLGVGETYSKHGVGADQHRGGGSPDWDKLLKTAEAEALKKAAVKLGVGLYLWDEESRAEVEQERQAAKAPPAPQSDKTWEQGSKKFRAVVGEVAATAKVTSKTAINTAVKAMLMEVFSVESTKELTGDQLYALAEDLERDKLNRLQKLQAGMKEAKE